MFFKSLNYIPMTLCDKASLKFYMSPHVSNTREDNVKIRHAVIPTGGVVRASPAVALNQCIMDNGHPPNDLS
jgi:hypothetical protein